MSDFDWSQYEEVQPAAKSGGFNWDQYEEVKPAAAKPKSTQVNPISAQLPGGQLLDKIFGSGTGQSLAQGAGQAVADLGTGLGNTIGKLGGLTIGAPVPQIPRANISVNAPNQTAASVGEFLPYLIPGIPAARLAKGAYEAVPYIGNVLSKAPNMINAGLTAGAYGGINANADPRSNNGLGSTLTSGLVGAGAQGAFGLAGKGVNALANTNLGNTVKAAARPLVDKYLGKLQNEATTQQGTLLKTPQQASERLQNVGGAPISLGELIDSPNLRGIYNSSANLPLSGQMPKIQQKVGMADDTANAAMNHLLGQEQPEKINSKLLDKLQDNHSRIEGMVKAHYDAANEIAKKAKFDSSDRSLTSAAATKYLKSAASTNKKNELSWLAQSPSDRALLKKIAQGPVGGKVFKENATAEELEKYANDSKYTIVDEPVKNPTKELVNGELVDKHFNKVIYKKIPSTLNDAIQTRSEIGERLAQAKAAGERGKQKLYETLYGTLSKDLDNNISKNGTPELRQAWQNANNVYKNEFVPYTEPDIRRLLKKEDTKDLTNALLKPENSTVLSHLSNDDKRLLLYQELNKSLKQSDTGEIEPVASKLWNNYSRLVTQYPNTMKNLLTPGDHELMKKVGSLYETTKSGRPIINPPENGAKLLKPVLKGVGTAAAVVTGALNPLFALGAGTLVGGGIAANRKAANFLTNPALLKAYTETNALARRALINEALPYKQGKVGNALRQLQKPVNALNYLLNPAQIGRLIGQQNQ